MRFAGKFKRCAAALAVAAALALGAGCGSALAATPEGATTPSGFLDAVASGMKVTKVESNVYSKHVAKTEGNVYVGFAFGTGWSKKPARFDKLKLTLKLADKGVGDTLGTSGTKVNVSMKVLSKEEKPPELAAKTYTCTNMANNATGINVKLRVWVPAHYAACSASTRNAQWSTYGHRLNFNQYSLWNADTLAKSTLYPIAHKGKGHWEDVTVQVNLQVCGIESQACNLDPKKGTVNGQPLNSDKLDNAFKGVGYDASSTVNYYSSGEYGCGIVGLFKKQTDWLEVKNKPNKDGKAGVLEWGSSTIKASGSKKASARCQHESKPITATDANGVEFQGWTVTKKAVNGSGVEYNGKKILSVKETTAGKVKKTGPGKRTATYTFCNADGEKAPSCKAYVYCSKCREAYFFGCGQDAAKFATRHSSHNGKLATVGSGVWSNSKTVLTATWNTVKEKAVTYYLDGEKLTSVEERDVPTFYRCDVSGDEIAESADCTFETDGTVDEPDGTMRIDKIQEHMDKVHNHHVTGHDCEHTYSGYYCTYCGRYSTSTHTHMTGYEPCDCSDCSKTCKGACGCAYSYPESWMVSATLFAHWSGDLGHPNTDYYCDKESAGCTWKWEVANSDGTAAAAKHEVDYDYFSNKKAYTKMYRTLSLEQAVSRAVKEGNLDEGTEVEGPERTVGAWFTEDDYKRFGTCGSRAEIEAKLRLGTCQGHSDKEETECHHADGSGLAELSRDGGDELEPTVWNKTDGLKLYAFTAVAVDGYADFAYIDGQYGNGDGVGDGVVAGESLGDSLVHTDWAVIRETYAVSSAMNAAAESKRAATCMDWRKYVGEDYWFTDPSCADAAKDEDNGEADEDASDADKKATDDLTQGGGDASARLPAAGVELEGPLDLFTRNKVQVSVDFSRNTVSMSEHMAQLREKDDSLDLYGLDDVSFPDDDFPCIKSGASGVIGSSSDAAKAIRSWIRDNCMPSSVYGRGEGSETAGGESRGIDDGHETGGETEYHWYGDIITGSHMDATAPGEDLYYKSSSGYVRKIKYNGLFCDAAATAASGPVRTGTDLPLSGSGGVENNMVLYMDWDDAVYDGIQGQ